MIVQAPTIPPEVLHLIFRHLAASSLFQCAQICRLWSEVALDWLWRELPSMYPLLRLLGDVTAVICEAPTSGWHVLMVHEWYASDWEQLYSYGRRVRSLTHKEWVPVQVHPGAPRIKATLLLEDVLTFTAGRPGAILPNLKEIHWGVAMSSSGLLSILPLVGPSLQVLDIEVHCPIHDNLWEPASRILRVVGRRKDIQIERFRWRVHPAYAADDDDLHALRVADFILAQRESLRAVDVICGRSDLIIQAVGGTETHDDDQSASRVTEFKIQCEDDHVDLELLLRIPFLETLSLFQGMRQPLEEFDVRKMGSAWPNMRRLELNDISGDLQDLAAFAIHLPDLEDLTIQLSLKDTRTPRQMVQFRRLRKLDLGSTFIIGLRAGRIDHGTVVEVLAHICPADAKIWVNVEQDLGWGDDIEGGEAFSMNEEGEEADGNFIGEFDWETIKMGLRKAHRALAT